MLEGRYPDLSNEDYHKDTAIGSSGLKAFSECPAIYEYEYLDPNKASERANKYTSIGSHAHVALLEPKIFEQNYIVADEFAITNKGKKNEDLKPMTKIHGDWKEFAQAAETTSKTALLYSEFKQARAMAAAIKAHELANSMLTGGRAEMSFFAKDEPTGLMMKARPDYLVKVKDIGIVLVDYKTTAIPLGITKQSNHAFSLSRHIQAAHHKRVTELATGGIINEVCYITQSQQAPYSIRVFRMPYDAIIAGEAQCRIYLDGIAECWQNGVFPDYPQIIEDYIMPKWMDYEFN